MVTIDGFPVFDALVTDDETGMFKISLVDAPAVMTDFVAFGNQRRTQLYAVENEEKRLIFGVVMRADFPIYRRDDRLGEYYVVYKPDTIRKMAEKYLAESRQNDVNTMHEAGSDVDGVQMVQWFIQDSTRGIVPEGFDVPDGSLFAEFHVINDEVWEAVKDGTYKGFSLEGVFDFVPETSVEEVKEMVDECDGEFEAMFKKIQTIITKETMSKIDRFKARLAKLLAAFGSVSTDKGVLAWDGDEDLKAGDAVYILDDEGNRTDAEDGEYVTTDAKTIVVADGKVSEIRDPEAEVAPTEEEPVEAGAVATDKGELNWEGEEDLKAGDAVTIDGEPAPDGDYTTEDGKVIVVVDGTVSEIKDAEAEVAPEVSVEERMARVKSAFEESYDEKMRKIAEAIAAVKGEDMNWYIREAGDDFVVVVEWGEDYVDHHYRYSVSWDEEGNASVSDRTEVKEMFVPVDYEDPFAKENTDLKAENATLKAKVEELSRQSTAKPAHEEFSEAGKTSKTGRKGLDRLARYVDAMK